MATLNFIYNNRYLVQSMHEKKRRNLTWQFCRRAPISTNLSLLVLLTLYFKVANMPRVAFTLAEDATLQGIKFFFHSRACRSCTNYDLAAMKWSYDFPDFFQVLRRTRHSLTCKLLNMVFIISSLYARLLQIFSKYDHGTYFFSTVMAVSEMSFFANVEPAQKSNLWNSLLHHAWCQ